MKEGRFSVEPGPIGARPDLSGLSCRFEEIATQRGVILSLIVIPASPGTSPRAFQAVVDAILQLSRRTAPRPVVPCRTKDLPCDGFPLGWIWRCARDQYSRSISTATDAPCPRLSEPTATSSYNGGPSRAARGPWPACHWRRRMLRLSPSSSAHRFNNNATPNLSRLPAI